MIRKFSLTALVAIVGFTTAAASATAHDYCHGGSRYHSGFSGYRPPVSYYNSAYGSWGPGLYSSNFGQPIPGTFSHGYSSYYGGGYGSGFHAPFGGYGVSGFPRYNTGAFGPGVTMHFGRW